MDYVWEALRFVQTTPTFASLIFILSIEGKVFIEANELILCREEMVFLVDYIVTLLLRRAYSRAPSTNLGDGPPVSPNV